MSLTNALSDFFLGNPFNTPVGSLVEEATEDIADAELWNRFSRVCETINHSPSGPKEAIRAIRRRFVTSALSNATVALHSLVLLETCVLNCGYRFHVVLATRDNLKDFARFVEPGIEGLPDVVRHKLLSLIQAWSVQFGRYVDLQEFVNVYCELKNRGVGFPVLPSTPQSQTCVSKARTVNLTGPPENAAASLSPEPVSQEPCIRNTPSQRNKLNADLAQVRVNVCALSDLITESESVSSAEEEEKVHVLMTEIADSLQEMSRRLVLAISSWEGYQASLPTRHTTDAVLLDLLSVNDELHTVLQRYSQVSRPKPTDSTSDVPSSSPCAADVTASTSQTDHTPELGSFVGEQVNSSAAPSTQTTKTTNDDAVPLLVPESESHLTDLTKDVSLIQF